MHQLIDGTRHCSRVRLVQQRRARCTTVMKAQQKVHRSNETIQKLYSHENDPFNDLGDRCDAPPIPISTYLAQVEQQPQTITMVRHGQSTWNARNRVQGSSNFSILTEKGIMQAEMASQCLKGKRFDSVFVSPLQRAVQTAEIILSASEPTYVRQMLPSLREIDLYSFQGMDKYSKEYARWKKNPAEFEIDGHAPVRELWYRASLAWRDILMSSSANKLVVAHNAVNQALLCNVLGLPYTSFRRIMQTNAAISRVTLDHGKFVVEALNYFPSKDALAKELNAEAELKLVLMWGEESLHVLIDQKFIHSSDANGGQGRGTVLAPLLATVGSPGEQAADVMTAVEANLLSNLSGHPKQSKVMVAVVGSEEACNLITKQCVFDYRGDLEGANEDWDIDRQGYDVDFKMNKSGISVLTFSTNSGDRSGILAKVLCTNYDIRSKNTN